MSRRPAGTTGQSATQPSWRGPCRRYGSPFSTTAYACSGGEFTARPEDFMAAIDTAGNGTHNTIRSTSYGTEA